MTQKGKKKAHPKVCLFFHFALVEVFGAAALMDVAISLSPSFLYSTATFIPAFRSSSLRASLPLVIFVSAVTIKLFSTFPLATAMLFVIASTFLTSPLNFSILAGAGVAGAAGAGAVVPAFGGAAAIAPDTKA